MPRRAAFIVAGALLFAAILATLFVRKDEPRYRHRTLVQWILDYQRPEKQPEAREAIVVIATNYAPVGNPRFRDPYQLPSPIALRGPRALCVRRLREERRKGSDHKFEFSNGGRPRDV